jgi:hypothetical protein
VDYSVERGLDKSEIHWLADVECIRKIENLLITGATDMGKSFTASALGH